MSLSQIKVNDTSVISVDNTVTEDSQNLIYSGSIAKLIREDDSEIGKLFITDKNGSVIAILTKDDILRFFVDIEVENLTAKNINTTENTVIESNSPLSSFDNVMFETKNGEMIFGYESNGDSIGLANDTKSVYELNINKDTELHSACRFNNTNPDFQFLVCSDTHETTKEFERFVSCGKDFETVNALIYLGDIINRDISYFVKDMEYFSNIIRESFKPFYYVCGNHEVGDERRAIASCATDLQLFDWFIKPMIDNGWLEKGDYTEGKMYYSHDFHNGTMLITLFPFDDGNCIRPVGFTYVNKDAIDDTIWRPIPYNVEYPEIVDGSTYSGGSKVNVKNYTAYSFEAVTEVTLRKITWGASNGWNCDNYPRYRAFRSVRWFSKTQLEWFCEKLKYAKENNLKVIIAQHLPFSTNVRCNTESVFSNGQSYNIGNYSYRYNSENADIISILIEACKNGTKSETPIRFKPTPWTKQVGDNYIVEDVTCLVPAFERTGIIDGVNYFDFEYDFSQTTGELKSVNSC